MHDERPQHGDYNVIFPNEMEERAKALGRMAKKIGAGDEPWQREEGRSMREAANNMLECVKEARFMGDPSDPAVQAFWALHKPGAKSTISLSAGRDKAGYPELPGVDRGPRTGRTATATRENVDTSATDADHTRIHRKPKKKSRTGLILDLG